MNHSGTNTLETKRLLLRRFTIDDAQDMYNNWASDDEVTKYLSWTPHKDAEASKAYIQSLIDVYSQQSTYNWGIEVKEVGQVVGAISAVHCKDDIECVEIGYCIGRRWWHRGITSEAFSAVIKYLMDEVKVNRIEARHDTRNPYSGKVMEKCGLKYEGTLRESGRNNLGICDSSWYALLRKDYRGK